MNNEVGRVRWWSRKRDYCPQVLHSQLQFGLSQLVSVVVVVVVDVAVIHGSFKWTKHSQVHSHKLGKF